MVSQHTHDVADCTGIVQAIHASGYAGALGLCSPQVDGNGRFLQPAPCCNSGVNIVNALDSYSSRQVLMQTVMNLMQEFDCTNWKATILWLDHVGCVTKKTGFDHLEIGMNKLKCMALHNVNAASKEGTLSYFWFCQLLIEHYLNVPYMLDTLNVYAHLT